MKIQIKKQDGLTLPKTGSDKSAGYDIVSISDPIINGVKVDGEIDIWKSIDYIEYKTGIFISPQQSYLHSGMTDFHTYIFPRSSISKYNLSLCNSVGLIDNDYRGEICFRFKYVIQPEDLVIDETTFGVIVNLDKIYKKGDKIGQIIACNTERIDFDVVDDLDKTDRGVGGFGSTDNQHLNTIQFQKTESKESTVDGALKAFKTIIDSMPLGDFIGDGNSIKIRSSAPKIEIPTTPPEKKYTEEIPYNQKGKSDIVEKWKETIKPIVENKDGYEKQMKERENNQ